MKTQNAQVAYLRALAEDITEDVHAGPVNKQSMDSLLRAANARLEFIQTQLHRMQPKPSNDSVMSP